MKKAIFNIPIRTLTINNQQLNYGVGARGVYCGAIGYIDPFMKKAIFNIPIRTLTIVILRIQLVAYIVVQLVILNLL